MDLPSSGARLVLEIVASATKSRSVATPRMLADVLGRSAPKIRELVGAPGVVVPAVLPCTCVGPPDGWTGRMRAVPTRAVLYG